MPKPSLSQLEAHAIAGTFADVKAYLLADSSSNFPELNGKLLISGPLPEQRVSPAEIEATMLAGLGTTATAQDRALIHNDIQSNPIEIPGTTTASSRFSYSMISLYNDRLSNKALAGKPQAYVLVLDRPDCLPCTYEKYTATCPTEIFPDKARLNQLQQFFIQHHEMGHIAGIALGLTAPNFGHDKASASKFIHFNELRSDIYASLRTIGTFGQEGIEFSRAFLMAREYRALGGDHEHNSQAMLKLLNDPASRKRLTEIAKSPRQALTYAHKMAIELQDVHIFDDLAAGGARADKAIASFNARAGKSGQQAEQQMNATYKLNPLRSPSQRDYNGQIISAEDIDRNKPDQIANLDKLKKILLPAECPVPIKAPLRPK